MRAVVSGRKTSRKLVLLPVCLWGWFGADVRVVLLVFKAAEGRTLSKGASLFAGWWLGWGGEGIKGI